MTSSLETSEFSLIDKLILLDCMGKKLKRITARIESEAFKKLGAFILV